MGPVRFVLPHLYPPVQYDVYSQEPQLRVEPLAGEWAPGWAGPSPRGPPVPLRSHRPFVKSSE